MLKALGIGDNVVDVYVNKNIMYPGGNTMNFCAYARRLGHEAGYIGVFGDDPPAKHVRSTAESLGIDLSHARFLQGENGCAKVSLIDGDRKFIGSNKGGISREFPPVLNENDLEYVKLFDVVHTSCFSYVDQELRKVKSVGTPISYDFSTNLETKHMKAVCPYLFLAVASCSHMSDEEVRQFARHISDMGAEMVLLSMGIRGAIAYDGHRIFYQKAGKEQAIDSMGAGDSFLTAFETTYLELRKQQTEHNNAMKVALQKAADFATEICMIDGAFGCGVPYEPEHYSEI